MTFKEKFRTFLSSDLALAEANASFETLQDNRPIIIMHNVSAEKMDSYKDYIDSLKHKKLQVSQLREERKVVENELLEYFEIDKDLIATTTLEFHDEDPETYQVFLKNGRIGYEVLK
jgi:hypothetical protein